MSDHPTELVLATDLTNSHVLVGDYGGLSVILEVSDSSLVRGMVRVETEHGPLYLDPDCEYPVLSTEGN